MHLQRLHQLFARLSAGSRHTSVRVAQLPEDGRLTLPMELWDALFTHCTDDTLLNLAVVCRPFNERCILTLLWLNGVSASDIAEGHYAVHPPVLPAFSRALYIPPPKNIICDLPITSDLPRHLAVLSGFACSPGAATLDSLALQFPQGHEWLYDASNQDLLRRTITSIAGSVVKEVIILVAKNFIRLPVQKLGEFFVRDEKSAKRYPLLYAFALPSLNSLTFHFHRTSSPSTVIVINDVEVVNIESVPDEVVPHHLNAALAHVVLPHLTSLTISMDSIDPTVMRAFLLRHPQVTHITDERIYSFESPESDFTPLISPPIELPNLQQVTTRNAALLIDTAPSKPRKITIDWGHPIVEVFNRDFDSVLTYLSQCETKTHLEFSTWSLPRTLADRHVALAKQLRCVDTVQLSSASFEDPELCLRWMGLFPALEEVSFCGWRKVIRIKENPDDLLRIARSILLSPGGKNIILGVEV
ncbi:hypothetical protein R3P38DRAFT_3608734 [Favolaschia claudopus]|uniref:F-box domain-containing protein n=1 Tax=Favolaschia claudopus TaxID=2862362 RepID=A0AAW0DH57_9AGAR